MNSIAIQPLLYRRLSSLYSSESISKTAVTDVCTALMASHDRFAIALTAQLASVGSSTSDMYQATFVCTFMGGM